MKSQCPNPNDQVTAPEAAAQASGLHLGIGELGLGASRSAAVLCPGPSLAHTWSVQAAAGYGIVIAVNRAAAFWPADYWVMLDAYTAVMEVRSEQQEPRQELAFMGSPIVVSSDKQLQKLSRMGVKASGLRKLALPGPIAPDLWKLAGKYSATVAAALAASLLRTSHSALRTSVDVFGCDLAGLEDFDGFCDPRQVRTSGRWKIEARIWKELRIANCDLRIERQRQNGLATEATEKEEAAA